MKKYKTFNEVKVGDILYTVECSNINCELKKTYVSYLYDVYDDNIVEMYIDISPLSFSFNRKSSSWHEMIFTTREEAIQSVKKQINKKVKEHLECVNMFNNLLVNIDDIEFKDTNKMIN